MSVEKLVEHFAALEDPRCAGKIDHRLTDAQSMFVRLAKEGEYRPYITSGGIIAPSAGFDFTPPRTSMTRPRVSRNFEPQRQRRSSVDVDVPEFIPRY